MGPLFSLVIILFVALALSVGTYLVARVFHMSRPLLVALAFPVGSAFGGGAAVLIAGVVLDFGATLTGSSQVTGYLAFLAGSSLISGLLAVRYCKRVLIFSLTGRATRAGSHVGSRDEFDS